MLLRAPNRSIPSDAGLQNGPFASGMEKMHRDACTTRIERERGPGQVLGRFHKARLSLVLRYYIEYYKAYYKLGLCFAPIP